MWLYKQDYTASRLTMRIVSKRPHLLAGDEVGGKCPCVVVDGVGDVVSKVL
jgi:hypothetical protein